MATTIQIKIPKLHRAQRQVVLEAKRFNVVACGRRFGKTELGKERLINGLRYAQPMAWFAPTYRMMLEVWREVSAMLLPISTPRVKEQRIDVHNGSVIEFWSLDSPDVARGRKYRRIIIDEAAMIPQLSTVFNNVMRPFLADYLGDAYFLSSTRGRNDFYYLFQRHKNESEWGAWQFPTSANPYIPPPEIEAMRRDMPERSYRQEILAEFVDDGGGVFRNVRQQATSELLQAPVANHTYVAGLDWALSHDYTVLTVLDATDKREVFKDRFNGVDYKMQRERIAATCQRFNISAILAEENAMGKPNNDELRRMGLPVRDFTTTNATKCEIIESLAAAFEQNALRILPDNVCMAELESYESKRTASGAVQYNAPDGMHDDTVMSLALAWAACDDGDDIGESPLFGYRG